MREYNNTCNNKNCLDTYKQSYFCCNFGTNALLYHLTYMYKTVSMCSLFTLKAYYIKICLCHLQDVIVCLCHLQDVIVVLCLLYYCSRSSNNFLVRSCLNSAFSFFPKYCLFPYFLYAIYIFSHAKIM